jgi:hydroxypyruvate reductase
MHFDAAFEALARNSFAAALAAGQPDRITRSAYAALDQQPTAVIALGKAAGAMAAAVRNGGYDGSGLVITTDENHRQIDGFDCFASAHPVPDERGLAAAIAVENLVKSLGQAGSFAVADQRWRLGLVASTLKWHQPRPENCAE